MEKYPEQNEEECESFPLFLLEWSFFLKIASAKFWRNQSSLYVL